MEIIFSLDGIDEAAAFFLKKTKGFHIYAFSGELGAGKTTFISAICGQLGVLEIVSSPTFSIIQQYKSDDGKIIYHMDLYRLKSVEEAENAGVEDCLFSDGISLVEWPENAPEIFPEKTVKCFLSVIPDGKRKLVCTLPAGY